MSNKKDGEKPNQSNQQDSIPNNEGANTNETNNNIQSFPTLSNNKDADDKKSDGIDHEWANKKRPFESDRLMIEDENWNTSDTISTGTANSLFFSTTDDSSGSLLTYDESIMKDDSTAFLEMTRDVAQSISTIIAVDGKVLPQLVIHLRGNFIANLVQWASTHLKGSTNMYPLENKDNIVRLVNNFKNVVKKTETPKSQVHFNEVDSKAPGRNDANPINPESSRMIGVSTEKLKAEPINAGTVQERNIVWDKLYSFLNLFKGLLFSGCTNDRNQKGKTESDLVDTSKNPVATTSKDPMALADLGKPRNSANRMIKLVPRSEIRNREAITESDTSDGEVRSRPKRPKSSSKEKHSKHSLKPIKSHSEIKDIKNPSSGTINSMAPLEVSKSLLETEITYRNRRIGLTQFMKYNTFQDPSNLDELVNLLSGLKATKDWARNGKYLFHYPEDLRTFGTLLAQIVGGCVLNGTITSQDSSYSPKKVRMSSLSKSDKNENENELMSGYLRALEMKDGVDLFTHGFQEGIHSFSPGIRRY